MSINYEWTTANPHLIMGDDNKTVVMQAIHWVRTATAANGTCVNSYGTARLEDKAKVMTYEEYELLDQEQVLAILTELLNVDVIDSALNAKL
jgi:hypothetical protein